MVNVSLLFRSSVLLFLLFSPITKLYAAPLVVQVVDHVTQLKMVNLNVLAYEKLLDGSLVWRASGTTDSGGSVPFELNGLGSGRKYVLRAQPYDGWANSEEISSAGSFRFSVGKLQIAVLDGRNDQPFASQNVQLLEKNATGALSWVASYRTDTEGKVRLDPIGLGSKAYVLRAISPVDGASRDSAEFSLSGLFSFKVGGKALAVQVVDHISGAGHAGLSVMAYEKLADGSLAWKISRTTDVEGRVSFDLDGLGSGRRYVLRASPYGTLVSSDEIASIGSYRFGVGKLQVSLIDGRNGSAFADQEVHLLEKAANGALATVAKYRTDREGKLRLDPTGLGTKVFLLRAVSPVDGANKDSAEYRQAGTFVFKVGGGGVVARVVDHITEAKLPGLNVLVYEKLPDGTLAWRVNGVTDGDGQVSFDLDGLGSGRRYVLRTSPYGSIASSEEISNAGTYRFGVGKLQVSVIDGRSGKAFAAQEVQLLEKGSGGSLVWLANYRTDIEGWVKLDPTELGSKIYLLRAKSPADGSLKNSSEFAQAGAYQFKVGGEGLSVQVVDHLSGAKLAGVSVLAYEKLADGTAVWRVSRTTDAEGQAVFDLAGLGAGRTYVLRTSPHGYLASSDEISSTGTHRFAVGKLQVALLDGRNGKPLVGQDVQLLEKQASGALIWLAKYRTDGEGKVKLDPAGLGKKAYVLRAASPADGSNKDSAEYTQGGAYLFRLGGGGLAVQVLDHVSGAKLSGVSVLVYEKQADGSLAWRVSRSTNTEGRVNFDLDGLGSGRKYVLRTSPYGYLASSDEVSVGGDYRFSVGKLQVALVDSRTAKPFSGQDVQLLEREANGSLTWLAKFRTDADGKVKLDPSGLGTKAYVLRVTSLVDGGVKESPDYKQAGAFVFNVHGSDVVIRLVDHITEAFLAGHAVLAYKKLKDGSLAFVEQKLSDAEGLARFDLADIGKGGVYVFKAKPYGYWAVSEEINTGGGFRLRAGTLPVSVTDVERGAALAAVNVQVFEKLASGTLVPAAGGSTDVRGVIRFDVEGLGKGRQYVLLAVNPFHDGENHYSKVISTSGAYSFALRRGSTTELDQAPPSIEILEPGKTAAVSVGGVRISGSADDENGVRGIKLVMTMPSGAVVEKAAAWRGDSKTWHVHTGRLEGDPGVVRLVMIATDAAYNEGRASLDLNLVKDTTAPVLSITSHSNGGLVPAGGFVLSGLLQDNTVGGTVRVTATAKGLGVWTQELEVSQGSGRWAATIAPQSTLEGTLVVQLVGMDASGNQISAGLTLQPSDVYAQAWHLLQRTSFGPTPDAYAGVLNTGVAGFIRAQLSSGGESDDSYSSRAASLPRGTLIATDLLRHATYGDQQLREVMTWFWENHFNTNYWTHNNSEFERLENETFRQHAIGNFRTLLGLSARSPAMLYTLDNYLSHKTHPNENYARELMELHSVGVDGGYTQRDVEEVARAFTGWTVTNGNYAFNAGFHDSGAKTVLGRVIPGGGGASDGEAVLDLLSAHPSTARFICRKLIRVFVADRPLESLTAQCSQTFISHRSSGDQIAQVLLTILNSPEFTGTTYRSAKLKTPIEFVVGAVRQFGGENGGDDLSQEIHRQGMELLKNPSPTGYPETADKWISAGMVHTRARFIDRLLSYATGGAQTQFDLAQQMRDEGFETAEGVAGRMLERLLGPNFNAQHRQLALDVLTEDGTYPYSASAPDAEARLRRLGKALGNLPEYQLQ